MGAFDDQAFDSTNAFDSVAFDFGTVTPTPTDPTAAGVSPTRRALFRGRTRTAR